MKPKPTIIYALDFDGVLCDSAIETAISGWKLAQQFWKDMPLGFPSEEYVDAFREVRPFLKTGYESILIMRLLFEGTSVVNLCRNYHEEIQKLVDRENIDIDELKKDFGEVRDKWIEQSFDEWLKMSPLFDGVADFLIELEKENCYIVTTKQERFVKYILEANDIKIDDEHIWGLEREMSKSDILFMIQSQKFAKKLDRNIIFIEDRLPSLMAVAEDKRLNDIELKLVSWGYNTLADREYTKTDERIELIDKMMGLTASSKLKGEK